MKEDRQCLGNNSNSWQEPKNQRKCEQTLQYRRTESEKATEIGKCAFKDTRYR